MLGKPRQSAGVGELVMEALCPVEMHKELFPQGFGLYLASRAAQYPRLESAVLRSVAVFRASNKHWSPAVSGGAWHLWQVRVSFCGK